MIFNNIDVENNRVDIFDLDFVMIVLFYDLEEDIKKTEFDFNFDQRISTSLYQSEFVTVSDWAISNNESHSISDFSYSNSNTINLLKKNKKQKNHLYFNNQSLFIKKMKIFTTLKLMRLILTCSAATILRRLRMMRVYSLSDNKIFFHHLQ